MPANALLIILFLFLFFFFVLEELSKEDAERSKQTLLRLKHPMIFSLHLNTGHPCNVMCFSTVFHNPQISEAKPKKKRKEELTMRLDRDISLPCHPQHKFKMEYTEVPFSCDGCKEAGIGLKYKCDFCDFDLHKICASAPTSIYHPFYKKCDFRFYTKPPGSVPRYCDACGKDVLGFVYHCNKCGFDLHPCCAKLPQTLEDADGQHFYLSWKISTPCQRCGVKGIGWSYRSECKNYNLHVSCVKELMVESCQGIYSATAREKVPVNGYGKTKLVSPKESSQHPPKAKPKGGALKKWGEIAGGAIAVVISALLGDPTALLATAVLNLITK